MSMKCTVPFTPELWLGFWRWHFLFRAGLLLLSKCGVSNVPNSAAFLAAKTLEANWDG